jgi:hypothetical protein
MFNSEESKCKFPDVTMHRGSIFREGRDHSKTGTYRPLRYPEKQNSNKCKCRHIEKLVK